MGTDSILDDFELILRRMFRKQKPALSIKGNEIWKSATRLPSRKFQVS